MPRTIFSRILIYYTWLALVGLVDLVVVSCSYYDGLAGISSGKLLFYALMAFATWKAVAAAGMASRELHQWRAQQSSNTLRQMNLRLLKLALFVVQTCLVLAGIVNYGFGHSSVMQSVLTYVGVSAMIVCWRRFLEESRSGCV